MATTNEVSSNLLPIDVLTPDTLPGSAAKNSILNPLSSSNSQNIGGSVLIDSKTQPVLEADKLSNSSDAVNSNSAIAEPNSKQSDDSLIVSDTIKNGISGSASGNTIDDTLSSSSGTDVKDTLTGISKDAPSSAIKDDTITATDSLTNPQSAEKITSDKTPSALAEKTSKPESATDQNTSGSEPKKTAISAATQLDKSTAEKPATTAADSSKENNKTPEDPATLTVETSKDRNQEKSPANTTENNKQSTDNTAVATVATAKELTATVPESNPIAYNSFTSGKFVVDSSGQVGFDFLFDGGLYKGQLAIISLKGMDKFAPGSEEFLKEAAARALSNSTKGHVVINDLSEGAKFTGNLPEGNYNEGNYSGVKTFAMTPGEEFGVMLVPNGTVQEVLNNPAIGGDKRPLFSMVTANPAEGFHVGQIADVTGSGKTFTMEDMRIDFGSDRDYNDFVFQVRDATGQAVNLDTVINAEKDWRKTDMGQALIAYAKPYTEPKFEPVKEDAKPANNTEFQSVLDVPIAEKSTTAKEEIKPASNPAANKDVTVSETKVTPIEEAKKESVAPISTFTESVSKAEIATSDKTAAVKIAEEKESNAPVFTATESVSKTEIATSDKTVTTAVKIAEEKESNAPVSTATESVSKTEIATSDKTVTTAVKIAEEKESNAPVFTPTEYVSKTAVTTATEIAHEGSETGFFSTNIESQPTDSVKNPVSSVEAHQPSSDTTVTPAVKIEGKKESIAPISYTETVAKNEVKTSDTNAVNKVEDKPDAIAPVSTTKTNQPPPPISLSPKTDDKPAIYTHEFALIFHATAPDSKSVIYTQEISAVTQSFLTDSKPVISTSEVAKPVTATNSQPATFIQEVTPVTQPVKPNSVNTTAINSQEKNNTNPTNLAQNVGYYPTVTATSFHFSKASQPLVGIIGTGFNGNNLDIEYSNITLGKDRIANDENPLIKSGEGSEQGTHVLGLIAANQNNSKGIDGINTEAPIWLGRASGNNSWAESLIEFVDSAKKSDRSNAVVNICFELTQVDADGKIIPRYELTEAEQNALEYARKNQIVVVVPAGNNPQQISALGKASLQFDNIITVGASSGGEVTDYSGTGKGLDILTEGGTLQNPVRSTVGESTGLMAGTSVAAARVTGAISQVWAANSKLNYQQVIDIIKRTATDIALPNWDAKTGAGLLNIEAAVPLAKATEPKPLLPEPTVRDVLSQINNLAPELDKLLEQFKAESDKITANPDSALVEPKPEDEKQASQKIDALIADLQKEIDDLQNDPFADVDGIAATYNFAVKDQPLVGIIDTGFAENNPDIDYSRIIKGRDRTDSDDNPLLPASDAQAEHGTKILEIIGAKQNNDIGINGVNDDAPLWLGRAIGSGKWAESLREFVDVAKASKQPNSIVNLSFDLTDKDGNTRTKFTQEEREAIEYARDNKVLIVAAAGNQGVEGLSALGKASREFSNIITVGATDGDGKLADYSSYGAGIDLVAFGSTPDSPASSNTNSNEDLLKGLTDGEQAALKKAIKFNEAPTDDDKLTEEEEKLVLDATQKLGKTLGDIQNSDTNSAESIPEIVGTSIAAAKVTGAASQVWAANPSLSFAQVKAILKATAVDLGTPGWDIQTGAGLLNLADAVAMAKSPPFGLDVADSILSSDSDVWNEEGTSAEREAFFKKLWNKAKKVFNKVSGFVGKVVGFVNKVSGFIGKVSGFFSKVSGIFSKVRKVFSWIGKKFLALPILGKVGIVLGGIGLVGGAIAGLVAWFKKKKQQSQPSTPTPVQNPTIPPEISKLEGIWITLKPEQKVGLWPLLKNPASVAFGTPSVQTAWNDLTPEQRTALTPFINPNNPGVPAQYDYLFP